MQSWMRCGMRDVGHDGVDANADMRMRVCGQYGDVIARYVSLQRKEKTINTYHSSINRAKKTHPHYSHHS